LLLRPPSGVAGDGRGPRGRRRQPPDRVLAGLPLGGERHGAGRVRRRRLPGRPQRLRGAVQRGAAGRRRGPEAGAPARRRRVRGLLRRVRQGAPRGARARVRPGQDADGVLRGTGSRGVRLPTRQVLRGAPDGRVQGPGPVRELGRRAPDAACVRGHGRAALPRGARVPAADQLAGVDDAGGERTVELIPYARSLSLSL
jgi:hypothetical protein